MEPKSLLTSSHFWRQSKAAYESGLMTEFFELEQIDRAWVIAYIEARDTLSNARDYIADQERPRDKSAGR